MAVNLPDEPSMTPDGGGKVSGGSSRVSGTSQSADPTNEPGQYPVGDWGTAIFGGPLPTGTGAPGTSGGGGNTDPTVEAGQLVDGLTGNTDAEITETGAPGTPTTPNDSDVGEDTITYTRPGSYLSGTYKSDTTNEDVFGTSDGTQANDIGYGTGGPQLPGIIGNEPVPGGKFQPAGGKVLRGGRYNG